MPLLIERCRLGLGLAVGGNGTVRACATCDNFPLFACPPLVKPISDGTGLAGARQAAKFVGGDVWLEANRLRTEFHLLLPASPSHLPPAVSSS
eukprot:scaffold39657_cov23-Tisochrysis_lutea.AAC.4